MDNSYSVLIGLLGLTIIVVFALLLIVILQNKKIHDLQTPKFGFLGKPLLVMLALGAVLFGTGTLYLSNQNTGNTDIPVSSTNYELAIQKEIISEEDNIYKFNAIPIVNGREWGIDPGRTFQIKWEFRNIATVTRYEYGLSQSFKGGIIITLQTGDTQVVATLKVIDTTTNEEKTIQEILNIIIN